MKIGPVMKGRGRTMFYINCLYMVEMRGEEDTEGVMAMELRDVCDGCGIRGSVCLCVLQPRCADHS